MTTKRIPHVWTSIGLILLIAGVFAIVSWQRNKSHSKYLNSLDWEGEVTIDQVVHVKDGETLSIARGSKLTFEDAGQIVVDGGISLIGDGEKGITVTTTNEDNSYTAPSFLEFNSECKLEGWTFKDIVLQEGGSIIMTSTSASFVSCKFQNIVAPDFGMLICQDRDRNKGSIKYSIKGCAVSNVTSPKVIVFTNFLSYFPFENSITECNFTGCKNLTLALIRSVDNHDLTVVPIDMLDQSSFSFCRNTIEGVLPKIDALAAKIAVKGNTVRGIESVSGVVTPFNYCGWRFIGNNIAITDNRIAFSSAQASDTPMLTIEARESGILENCQIFSEDESAIISLRNTQVSGCRFKNVVCNSYENVGFENCEFTDPSFNIEDGDSLYFASQFDACDDECDDEEEILHSLSFDHCSFEGKHVNIRTDALLIDNSVFSDLASLTLESRFPIDLFRISNSFFPSLEEVRVIGPTLVARNCYADKYTEHDFRHLGDSERKIMEALKSEISKKARALPE